MRGRGGAQQRASTLFAALITVLFVGNTLAKEVLPDNCNCRDWYGGCRQFGESWTDDETWVYRCGANDGSPAALSACQVQGSGIGAGIGDRQIPVGANQTIGGFWYSCEVDEVRHKYAQEPQCVVNGTHYHVGDNYREGSFQWVCLESGRWVSGCYYQNETKNSVLLGIGEVGYNGLIRHTCDRYKENPGRVQYHAEIRDDVPYKNPGNKGTNKNFPELIDNRLKYEPIPWTHQNVISFIANEDAPNTKVRYLPASRSIHQPLSQQQPQQPPPQQQQPPSFSAFFHQRTRI